MWVVVDGTIHFCLIASLKKFTYSFPNCISLFFAAERHVWKSRLKNLKGERRRVNFTKINGDTRELRSSQVKRKYTRTKPQFTNLDNWIDFNVMASSTNGWLTTPPPPVSLLDLTFEEIPFVSVKIKPKLDDFRHSVARNIRIAYHNSNKGILPKNAPTITNIMPIFHLSRSSSFLKSP